MYATLLLCLGLFSLIGVVTWFAISGVAMSWQARLAVALFAGAFFTLDMWLLAGLEGIGGLLARSFRKSSHEGPDSPQ